MQRLHLVLLPLFFLVAAGLLLNDSADPATDTGHIAGQVVDANGDALVGANVHVEGTTLGAATDRGGRYLIRDVPVGTYTVTAAFIGFEPKSAEIIHVQKDATTTLDFTLSADTTLDYEAVVTYERPVTRDDAAKSHNEVEEEAALDLNMDLDLSDGSVTPPSAMSPAISSMQRTRQATGAGLPGHYAPPVDREGYAAIIENDFRRPTDAPLSTFSIDVDAASYANTRRFLDSGRMPVKDAVRIEELVNYFEYDYPDPDGEHPFAVVAEVSEAPWAPEHRLVHIGLQGERIDTDDLPPSNLVFLIDVSGSMGSPDKLPLLKQAFRLLASNLRDEDRVGIVVYAGAAGVVLEPTNDRAAILEALDRLQSGGSTAGGAGIRLAYKLARQHFNAEKNNRVILATDGDFNVGASSDAEMMRMIERERESGVFLSVLGFGTGNLQDSKMETIANHGNGHYAYIDSVHEARKVLVNEMGGTLVAIAKDVKIQVEFNPAHVAAYRLVGYENRLLNDEDFNDDTKDAGELGAGHTVTALYEIIPHGVENPAGTVDALKYQQRPDDRAAASPEMLTVKLRYKQPDGDTSRLLERTLVDRGTSLRATSNAFRFSAAVAQFGLLLRDSEHKAEASYPNVLALARGAKGADAHGYRAEFIRLVETAEVLSTAEVATR